MGGGFAGPAYTASGRAVTSFARYADDAVRFGYGSTATVIGYVAQPFARPIGVKILATGPVESFYEKLSPDVSSERNATDVTSGGTPSGKGKKSVKKMVKPVYRKGRDPCPPGYRLRTHNGRRMCVKI